jgi:hypothetical protein
VKEEFMEKVLGGAPVSVALKLIAVCFIVGLGLVLVGIDPLDLWRDFGATIRDVWMSLGDALQWAIKYVALGAVVVVPLWIIYRILKAMTSTSKS